MFLHKLYICVGEDIYVETHVLRFMQRKYLLRNLYNNGKTRVTPLLCQADLFVKT